MPAAVAGDDFCGSAIYTLIYDYTPLAAVPEPSTWSMVLMGFGAVGLALRRKRMARRAVA